MFRFACSRLLLPAPRWWVSFVFLLGLVSPHSVVAQATQWGGTVLSSAAPVSNYSGEGTVPSLRPDGGSTLVVVGAAEVRVGGTTLQADARLNNRTATAAAPDGWVVTLNAAGRTRRVVPLRGHSGVRVLASAMDSVGNFYFAGGVYGRLVIGTDTVANPPPAGAVSVFACKMDSTGRVVWLRTLGSMAGQSIFTCFVEYARLDARGRLYVVGLFNGTLAVGARTYVSRNDDAFLMGLSPTGQVQWMQQAGSSNADRLGQFSVDQAGNSYASFVYTNFFALGSLTLAPVQGREGALVRLDVRGVPVWSQTLRGTGAEILYYAEVSPNGRYLYCGAYSQLGANGFGVSVGTDQYVLLRLNPATGLAQWQVRADPVAAAKVDNQGTVFVTYLTGSTTAPTVFGPGVSIPATPSYVPIILARSSTGAAQWVIAGRALSSTPVYYVSDLLDLSLGPQGDLCASSATPTPLLLGTDTLKQIFPASNYPNKQNLWRVRPPLRAGTDNSPQYACPGATFAIPVFLTTGTTLPSGTMLRAELSDATGIFNTPVVIGSAPVGATAVPIVLPAATAAGTGYRVRVVTVGTGAPTWVSTGPGVSLVVQTQPYVAVQSPAVLTLCPGDPPALLQGTGGVGATLQWLLGGVAIPGATGPTFAPLQTGAYTLQATSSCGVATSAPIAYATPPQPNVLLAAFAPVAFAQPAFPLTGGTPAGGQYSGPGVTNNQFSPSAAGLGFHQIRYTYTAPTGCSNSTTAPLEVRQSLSVVAPQPALAATCYPTPIQEGFLHLRITTTQSSKDVTGALYNMLGQLLQNRCWRLTGQTSEAEMDVHRLAPGLYTLQLRTGEGQTVLRFVVQ